MISIVIPAYNYADYLPDAIDSIVSQGADDLEIIVCDDASTDGTPEVVRRYAERHPCIRSVRNPRNLGALGNINHAMGLARGDYVLLLGADDYLEPGALQALLDTLEAHPELGFAYGRYNIRQADGNLFNLQHPGWSARAYAGGRDELVDLLCFDCYINMGTTLFRRRVLDGRPFFDPGLQALPTEGFFRATDWDLMLRLSLEGVSGAYLDRQIAVFRQHATQASGADKYAASGLAILEHLVLLDRYMTMDNLPRLKGRLPEIFRLVYGKYLFYRQNVQPANAGTDHVVRQRFHAMCQRMTALLAADESSTMPSHLETVLMSEVRKTPDDGPLFSVILTTYNRPRLLVDAISSVLAQTLQDWEIILINDGGDLAETVLDWVRRDARITYIRQPNRGVSVARNTAIKLARGQYIAYLDDDDIMLPDHLAVLAAALEQQPEAVVYTDSEMVQEEVDSGIRRELARSRPYAHEEFDFALLQISNYIPINTFAHARSWFDRIGAFDATLPAVEDWDLLIRLSRVTNFVHLRKQTVEVRQRQGAKGHLTQREGVRMKALFERLYARYDDQDNPVIRAGRAAVMAADHPARATLQAVEYQKWQGLRRMRNVDADILGERMLTVWGAQPLMTLVVRSSRNRQEALGQTIDALQSQLYENWRLIVVADYPAPDPVFTESDLLGWLEVDSLDDPSRFSEACNIVINEVPGDWIGFFPAGIEFRTDWLLRCADHIRVAGKDQLAFYVDHDVQLLPGTYHDPQLKPDFNLEYLLSWDYVGETCWFDQTALSRLGGMQPFPGAEVYELLLRLHDQHGAPAIGHLADPLLHLPERVRGHYDLASRRVAVENHLERRGRVGEVIIVEDSGTLRVVYPLKGTPLVSIVIPNRDKLEFLQPCLETLFEKTRYRHFEVIIVDNQSEDPDTHDFYRRLERAKKGQVRVLSYEEEFNFSVQCNLGVMAARGEYVLLLNNDIEIIQPEWLERMLMHAQHDDVGIVGAKLVYPETGKLQHAGIVLGSGSNLMAVAAHLGEEGKIGDAGYMNRYCCDMELSAVTAACQLVRKSVYNRIGGYDAKLGVLYNDVDFCLRAREAGLRVVWASSVVLVHHHGKSVNAQMQDPARLARLAERNKAETTLMLERWLPQLSADPAYNRNMRLEGRPLELDMQLPIVLEPAFDERLRILATGVRSGSGQYRIMQPLDALSEHGLAQTFHLCKPDGTTRLLTLPELARQNPHVMVVQNALNDIELDMLRLYKTHLPGIRKVMTLDDLVTALPEKSNLYRHFKANFPDSRRRLREASRHLDRMIASTEPLAEFVRQFHDDVIVVPNRLKKSDWGQLESRRQAGTRPRVGWVGAMQHKGDLEILHEVIEATADEVDWVFMGMWPEGMDHLIREKVEPVPFARYPARMAALNLDLAVAPLEMHAFNESKSNLRLLEYGALGWPVVCTSIDPYKTNNAPVTRVPNTTRAWIDAIRERVHEPAALAREGDQLKAWVMKHYMLEDHLEDWLKAYTF